MTTATHRPDPRSGTSRPNGRFEPQPDQARSPIGTATAKGETDVTSMGIAFTPFEDRFEVIEQAASLAEARGFQSVAVAEAMTLAAPVVLARLAERTERIGLTSGVLSVWGRTPATLALAAAELQRASGGRFVLGLGSGTAPITEGFHGQPWEAPLRKVRDTLIAVRALLAGGRLPDVPDGVRALRLGCLPAAPVPIALAAITPPGIRLAGALAEQWVPFLLPPAALDAGRELMAGAAEGVGRADATTVVASVPLALAADRAGAARLAARWLLTYATRMGPVYPRVLGEHGYHRELAALLDANRDLQEAHLPVAAERLARDVLLYGTYDEAPALCENWLEHADAVSVVAPFGVPAAQITEAIRAISSADAAQPPARPRPDGQNLCCSAGGF
jgi:alkanesulfonate monooxygenase SsuD/methylene tetrahydromethanopterin reductase-like flavin-dependent oxidoreductase (luciferase family)